MDLEAIKQMLDLFKTYGALPIIAVGFLFIFWRVIVWFRPRMDAVIDGHLKLMRTLERSQRFNNSAIKRLVQTAEASQKIHFEIEKQTHAIAKDITTQTDLIRNHHIQAMQTLNEHHNFAVEAVNRISKQSKE